MDVTGRQWRWECLSLQVALQRAWSVTPPAVQRIMCSRKAFHLLQYGQDEVVIDILGHKRGGFFLDLAANDAMHLSNTYSLETMFDWGGLCIEV